MSIMRDKQKQTKRRMIPLFGALVREILDYIEAIVRHFPGRSGVIIRRIYYRLRFKHLGRNVRIEPGVRFVGHRYISIDDDSHIDFGCLILAGPVSLSGADVHYLRNRAFTLEEGEISIGKAVHIAPGCYLLGHGGIQIGDYCGCAGGTRIISITNHYTAFKDRARRDVYFTPRAGREHMSYILGAVVLEDNVGIASNAVLFPGTIVSKESFLTVGAVAYGTIPPNSIVSGDPARRIRDRFRSDEKQK